MTYNDGEFPPQDSDTSKHLLMKHDIFITSIICYFKAKLMRGKFPLPLPPGAQRLFSFDAERYVRLYIGLPFPTHAFNNSFVYYDIVTSLFLPSTET